MSKHQSAKLVLNCNVGMMNETKASYALQWYITSPHSNTCFTMKPINFWRTPASLQKAGDQKKRKGATSNRDWLCS
jgi:quinolinate synthase